MGTKKFFPKDKIRRRFTWALKSYRIENRLTAKEMCEQLGVERSHYSKLENGCCMPNLYTFYRFCEATGHSADDLLK